MIPRNLANRVLLALALTLSGCLDNGLMIGDGGTPDGNTPDTGVDAATDGEASVDAATDGEASDTSDDVTDSNVDAATDGPSTVDCPAPWLYYVSALDGAARVLRHTITAGDLRPCPPLTGGGAILPDASSVAVVGHELVIVGNTSIQGLSVASDAITWTEEVRTRDDRPRSAIARMGDGFVVGWAGSRDTDSLVTPTFFDAERRSSRFPIDNFHFDLAAAPSDPARVWSARSPGIVALIDPAGGRSAEIERAEGRIMDADRLFAVRSGRIVITQSFSRSYYEASAAERVAVEQRFEYDAGCEEFHLAVPHPMDASAVFLACRRNADSEGTVRALTLFEPRSAATGVLSPLVFPDAGEAMWDIAVYEP